MSDIWKAEELLEKVLRVHSFERFPTPGEREQLHSEIEEYFRKPVFIGDAFGNKVEIYRDEEDDLVFTWSDLSDEDVHFSPEELLRGLREVGVIE